MHTYQLCQVAATEPGYTDDKTYAGLAMWLKCMSFQAQVKQQLNDSTITKVFCWRGKEGLYSYIVSEAKRMRHNYKLSFWLLNINITVQLASYMQSTATYSFQV